jgi:hypothetical protein
MKRTLYSTLQVTEDADVEIIQAAFERVKAKLAPRLAAGDQDALTDARMVKEAHDTLIDPARRAAYDQSLARSSAAASYSEAIEVAPFWTGTKVVVMLLMISIGGGWYYRAETKKAEAVATKAAEDRKRVEALAAQEAERRAAAVEVVNTIVQDRKEREQKAEIQRLHRDGERASAQLSQAEQRKAADEARQKALRKSLDENRERQETRAAEARARAEMSEARRRLADLERANSR